MRNSYLFLGFAIPNEEMQKVFELDNFPQIQTHKFNWNLIKGLEYHNEFDFTYISSRPVTDYPNFPQKKINKNEWLVRLYGKNVKIIEVPFYNKGILKLVTRFFSTIYYSIKNFHAKKNKSGVIVYSVNVPYMIVGLIISKIYKMDYIAIWTDPPSVVSVNDIGIKSKLRSIELNISKFLMKRASKVIALTKDLAKDFAPDKPYIVMEGIIDDSEAIDNYNKDKNDNNTRVVYAGSLSKRYGIKNIVEAFILLDDKSIILEVYGRGDYESELAEVCRANKNILYKGFISNKEVLRIQRNADFLINARSDKDDYVKYSFPSKTLEYMLSGTPFITTMLPGIPDEYRDYVIELDNNEKETIKNKIIEVANYDMDTRDIIGHKAQQFAKTKNYYDQGKNTIEFLKKN